jgi:hypothetical protein
MPLHSRITTLQTLRNSSEPRTRNLSAPLKTSKSLNPICVFSRLPLRARERNIYLPFRLFRLFRTQRDGLEVVL